MTTALASDSLAFNSEYNLSSFLEGIEETMKHSYDIELDDVLTKIRAKSKVISLGIDFNEVDTSPEVPRHNTPVIIWNHRWEHDKNPELFFETLFELDSEGVDFRLIVLGESFKDSPEIFEKAKRKLNQRIIHYGYPASRKEYAGWLKHGDIIVSTSYHEFFGIAVLEAVRAGCRPLLPRRLSYPELYPDEYLYDDANVKKKLKDVITGYKRLSPKQSRELTERFTWEHLSRDYEAWIRSARVE
jgi:glycosyltransferase involved in cell wall biosynthesis